MILGLSDTEKKFKTAMDTAGADMTVVNSWIKLYVKTKKNSSGVAKRYYGVKTGLSSLLSDLKELEQQVIGYCELTGTDRKHFGELIKACKAKSGMFDDEFLISKVDTDFHTTLDSVVKQGERYLSSFDNGIILQSEIENLGFPVGRTENAKRRSDCSKRKGSSRTEKEIFRSRRRNGQKTRGIDRTNSR